jgi:FlaA1/EpsC-like NDP-sugar epimerase
MGKPVKIRYLAEQMIRLAGREPDRDIAIRYVGLRPGEKLYEELFYDAEDLVETTHPKIRAARRQTLDVERVSQGIEALSRALAACDDAALMAAMRRLVPEWQSPPPASQDSILAALPAVPPPAPRAAAASGRTTEVIDD